MSRIYTSYFGNLKKLRENGVVPINIARFAPKWFQGDSLMYLAPKPFMLNKTITEEQYIKLYTDQILSKVNMNMLISDLKRFSMGKDVALLCWEKPGDFCHRHLVAELLKKNKFTVIEWGSDLQVKEEVQKDTQASLF